MVQLLNINLTDTYIECHYYPENNKTDKGYIRLNTKTKEIIDFIYTRNEDILTPYFNLAKIQLIKILEDTTLSKNIV
jgi:hypothetical protein